MRCIQGIYNIYCIYTKKQLHLIRPALICIVYIYVIRIYDGDFRMWGNWRTDIILNVQYSVRRVKKICRFLTMDSGTTMHASAWSEWASSNEGIHQNRLPFNIRWDCDVPKKNNLGASVLINPKLCTLNPPKKTCAHLGSNLFKALQGFPCTYSLSLGFTPSKCTSSPAKSCNTGISAPSSRKNRPHSTWNMKKKLLDFCSRIFTQKTTPATTCHHLPL